MIFTASYFKPECHHGELISISRQTPNGFTVDDEFRPLAPNAILLSWWKKVGKAEDDWSTYRQRYYDRLKLNKPSILQFFQGITANGHDDYTLLCWEHNNERCHRSLVGEILQKKYPDHWGGDNVPLEAKADFLGVEVDPPAIAPPKQTHTDPEPDLGPIVPGDWVILEDCSDTLKKYVPQPLRVRSRDGDMLNLTWMGNPVHVDRVRKV